MTEKSSRKDWPNLKEVLESSRSEEALKSKSEKSRTELPTLSAPPRLPSQKVSFPEVEQPFCTPQKNSTNS